MATNRTNIAAPSTTIWGRVQHRQKLADGVYSVETAGHGGVVVSVLVADRYMSDKAKAVIGSPEHGWWHFEEDCDWAIFANENRDLVPQKWLEYIDNSLQQYNPDYLTMTAEEIKAEREAAAREAREAYERYEAMRQLRADLFAKGWGGKKKVYANDQLTITVSEHTDYNYPCTLEKQGKEAVNTTLPFEILYDLIDCVKLKRVE